MLYAMLYDLLTVRTVVLSQKNNTLTYLLTFVHVGRHNCVRKMVFRFKCAVLWKLHG